MGSPAPNAAAAPAGPSARTSTHFSLRGPCAGMLLWGGEHSAEEGTGPRPSRSAQGCVGHHSAARVSMHIAFVSTGMGTTQRMHARHLFFFASWPLYFGSGTCNLGHGCVRCYVPLPLEDVWCQWRRRSELAIYAKRSQPPRDKANQQM